MKKLSMCFVFILLLVMVMTACSSGPSDEECEGAWNQLQPGRNANANTTDYDSYEEYTDAFDAEVATVVSMLLNKEHVPDSVGYILKECINSGWDYRAAAGME